MTLCRTLPVALIVFVFSGCTAFNARHTRTDQGTTSAEGAEVLELSTFNGGVTISPGNGTDVEYSVRYTAYGETDADAQAACETLSCEVSQEGGVLKITALNPKRYLSAGVAFELKVPHSLAVRVDTTNGEVQASGLRAGLTVDTSNGTIDCKTIAGDLDLKNSNGGISVFDASGTANLKTSNGNIRYSGMLTGMENKLSSSNGSIQLSISPKIPTYVTASTSNGRVNCKLPRVKTTAESKTALEALLGTEGDAQTSVQLSTSNGSVTIDVAR